MPIKTSPNNVVLIGLESVGKSALFRALTGQATGGETNFRGSTVVVQTATLLNQAGQLVDTPGIRVQGDSDSTRLALQQIYQADTVVLVIRGTHAKLELMTLLREFSQSLRGHKATLVITFGDKASPELPTWVNTYQHQLGIPVVLVNARQLLALQHQALLTAIQQAAPMSTSLPIALFPELPVVEPQLTLFEHPKLGPWLSLWAMLLLFGLPVYTAYIFANWFQPIADATLISPLLNWLTPLTQSTPLLSALLVGDYGLVTLGWYSFLWAFPVVLLIGLSVAMTEEIGLKDRITAALDPWLRHIGLDGRDLIPVLTGFGCNVVAVYQSRACNACSRKACISLIAYGSACSYQIGASLSLFNSAQKPWLFGPYLVALFVVGAIYTRLCHKPLAVSNTLPLADRAFLQSPSWHGIRWRVKTVLKKFLFEAMPIFLIICVVGALLAYSGFLTQLADLVSPILNLFGLPGSAAPGIIFSIVRKDGLLVLNQGDGALLTSLTPGQVFILVYLASTLSACLVTVWTIGRELGWRYAALVVGQQAGTAIVSGFILAVGLRFVGVW